MQNNNIGLNDTVGLQKSILPHILAVHCCYLDNQNVSPSMVMKMRKHLCHMTLNDMRVMEFLRNERHFFFAKVWGLTWTDVA